MSPKAEKHRVDARIPPSRQRLAENPRPISVAELANEIDTDARRRVTWREGTKETLHSRFFALQVSMSYRDRPYGTKLEEQCSLIEWLWNEPKPTKYWLSTLAASSARQKLVQTARICLRIELDCQVLKQELGLNQHVGQNWRGLNHHASLCIAVYGFLVSERLKHPLRKRMLSLHQI